MESIKSYVALGTLFDSQSTLITFFAKGLVVSLPFWGGGEGGFPLYLRLFYLFPTQIENIRFFPSLLLYTFAFFSPYFSLV